MDIGVVKCDKQTWLFAFTILIISMPTKCENMWNFLLLSAEMWAIDVIIYLLFCMCGSFPCCSFVCGGRTGWLLFDNHTGIHDFLLIATASCSSRLVLYHLHTNKYQTVHHLPMLNQTLPQTGGTNCLVYRLEYNQTIALVVKLK